MLTIQETRALVGQQLGLAGFDGSRAAYSALSAPDQERVTIATVRFVLDNPNQFTTDQLRAAETAASRAGFGSTGDYADPTFLQSADAFVRAYGSTAGEAVTGAAGVAGRAASALGLNLGVLAGVAIVAAVLYFGAPYVLPKLRAAFKPASPPAS